MPDTVIIESFVRILQSFEPCFTAPSFRSFVTLACGWVLTLGRHTVTAAVRGANAVGWKHVSSFHRFFGRARWMTDEVGLVLVRLVDAHIAKSQVLVVPVDDTLGRHTGKKIAAASMHRDPLLSSGKRPLFHWGHVWVVLSINVRAFDKTWSLPVLFRLYRSVKRCAADKCEHRKTTELAAELIRLLAKTLPERRIHVVGDAAYTNSSVIKKRPKNVTIVGRSRLDAALYEPAPKRNVGCMGRPRVRGAKLPSPQERIAKPKTRWRPIEVWVYGRSATVRVLVIDALWYVAAGSELVRMVVVRDFPGHERDDVFVSTDPQLDPKSIIENYCQRWALEVTFHESKGKLGLEEPQNRTARAVERTAPMALWLYSLVVLWYLKAGHKLRSAQPLPMPWYTEKTSPAFSDMLAALRRASWAERLLDPAGNKATFRKHARYLLNQLDAAA